MTDDGGGLDGFLHAFGLQRKLSTGFETAAAMIERGLRHKNFTRFGLVFNSGGDIYGMAHDTVFRAGARTDVTRDHFAGVDADTDGYLGQAVFEVATIDFAHFRLHS